MISDFGLNLPDDFIKLTNIIDEITKSVPKDCFSATGRRGLLAASASRAMYDRYAQTNPESLFDISKKSYNKLLLLLEEDMASYGMSYSDWPFPQYMPLLSLIVQQVCSKTPEVFEYMNDRLNQIPEAQYIEFVVRSLGESNEAQSTPACDEYGELWFPPVSSAPLFPEDVQSRLVHLSMDMRRGSIENNILELHSSIIPFNEAKGTFIVPPVTVQFLELTAPNFIFSRIIRGMKYEENRPLIGTLPQQTLGVHSPITSANSTAVRQKLTEFSKSVLLRSVQNSSSAINGSISQELNSRDAQDENVDPAQVFNRRGKGGDQTHSEENLMRLSGGMDFSNNLLFNEYCERFNHFSRDAAMKENLISSRGGSQREGLSNLLSAQDIKKVLDELEAILGAAAYKGGIFEEDGRDSDVAVVEENRVERSVCEVSNETADEIRREEVERKVKNWMRNNLRTSSAAEVIRRNLNLQLRGNANSMNGASDDLKFSYDQTPQSSNFHSPTIYDEQNTDNHHVNESSSSSSTNTFEHFFGFKPMKKGPYDNDDVSDSQRFSLQSPLSCELSTDPANSNLAAMAAAAAGRMRQAVHNHKQQQLINNMKKKAKQLELLEQEHHELRQQRLQTSNPECENANISPLGSFTSVSSKDLQETTNFVEDSAFVSIPRLIDLEKLFVDLSLPLDTPENHAGDTDSSDALDSLSLMSQKRLQLLMNKVSSGQPGEETSDFLRTLDLIREYSDFAVHEALLSQMQQQQQPSMFANGEEEAETPLSLTPQWMNIAQKRFRQYQQRQKDVEETTHFSDEEEEEENNDILVANFQLLTELYDKHVANKNTKQEHIYYNNMKSRWKNELQSNHEEGRESSNSSNVANNLDDNNSIMKSDLPADHFLQNIHPQLGGLSFLSSAQKLQHKSQSSNEQEESQKSDDEKRLADIHQILMQMNLSSSSSAENLNTLLLDPSIQSYIYAASNLVTASNLNSNGLKSTENSSITSLLASHLLAQQQQQQQTENQNFKLLSSLLTSKSSQSLPHSPAQKSKKAGELSSSLDVEGLVPRLNQELKPFHGTKRLTGIDTNNLTTKKEQMLKMPSAVTSPEKEENSLEEAGGLSSNLSPRVTNVLQQQQQQLMQQQRYSVSLLGQLSPPYQDIQASRAQNNSKNNNNNNNNNITSDSISRVRQPNNELFQNSLQMHHHYNTSISNKSNNINNNNINDNFLLQTPPDILPYAPQTFIQSDSHSRVIPPPSLTRGAEFPLAAAMNETHEALTGGQSPSQQQQQQYRQQQQQQHNQSDNFLGTANAGFNNTKMNFCHSSVRSHSQMKNTISTIPYSLLDSRYVAYYSAQIAKNFVKPFAQMKKAHKTQQQASATNNSASSASGITGGKKKKGNLSLTPVNSTPVNMNDAANEVTHVRKQKRIYKVLLKKPRVPFFPSLEESLQGNVLDYSVPANFVRTFMGSQHPLTFMSHSHEGEEEEEEEEEEEYEEDRNEEDNELSHNDDDDYFHHQVHESHNKKRGDKTLFEGDDKE